jgi:putative copper export protein
MGIAFNVLNALPPGRYTLSWRTAASDGHPSSGKFTFVVLPATTQASGLSPPTASAGDSIGGAFSPGTMAPAGKAADVDDGEVDAASSVGNSIARAFLFLSLLALVGAISFKLLVLRGTRTVRVDAKERMSQRAATLGMIAAAVLILVALLRLYLESQMMSAMPDMPGMRAMGIRDMVMATDWGFAFRIQIAASIAALVGFALAIRRIRGGWFVATASALVLAITPALGGHAAASPKFTSLMIAADWLHVLGGASWLGSLLCLMVIGVPIALTLHPPERWPSIASLVNAFSPVALVSAGVVVASGVFASWIHLQHLSALWQTTYGKTLLVKLLLVAITFAIGTYNFRRVQPRLLTEIGASRLGKSAAIELAVGFMILLVTGLLTGVAP